MPFQSFQPPPERSEVTTGRPAGPVQQAPQQRSKANGWGRLALIYACMLPMFWVLATTIIQNNSMPWAPTPIPTTTTIPAGGLK